MPSDKSLKPLTRYFNLLFLFVISNLFKNPSSIVANQPSPLLEADILPLFSLLLLLLIADVPSGVENEKASSYNARPAADPKLFHTHRP